MYGRQKDLRVEAFINVDLSSYVDDRRSTSGYCIVVGGKLVTWHGKKQPVVAQSSAVAEFRVRIIGFVK